MSKLKMPTYEDGTPVLVETGEEGTKYTIKLHGGTYVVSLVNTGCHYYRGQRIIHVWQHNRASFIDLSRGVTGEVDLPTATKVDDMFVVAKYVRGEYHRETLDSQVRIKLESLFRSEDFDHCFRDISAAYRRKVIGGW